MLDKQDEWKILPLQIFMNFSLEIVLERNRTT